MGVVIESPSAFRLRDSPMGYRDPEELIGLAVELIKGEGNK